MIFKILNGQTPDYLSNKFIFRNDTTSYRLRNSEMRLAFLQPRTALWNSLATDIRVSKTLGEFKTKLSNSVLSELMTRRLRKAVLFLFRLGYTRSLVSLQLGCG